MAASFASAQFHFRGAPDVFSMQLIDKEPYMSIVERVARSSLLVTLTLSLSTAADAGGRGQIGTSGTFGPNGSTNVVVRDHRGDAPPGEISVYPPCTSSSCRQGGLGGWPAQQQNHQTGGGGQVNDHRTGH